MSIAVILNLFFFFSEGICIFAVVNKIIIHANDVYTFEVFRYNIIIVYYNLYDTTRGLCNIICPHNIGK